MVNNLPNNTLEIMKNEWDELLKAVKNAAHVYHLFRSPLLMEISRSYAL